MMKTKYQTHLSITLTKNFPAELVIKKKQKKKKMWL